MTRTSMRAHRWPILRLGAALRRIRHCGSYCESKCDYDITSRLEATELTAHGQTALQGDYETQASLDFSKFNIGALLETAHISGLTGESDIEGTVKVQGPLARPEQMRGDARFQQLAVTIAGVHLHSEGGLHASMGNSQITLDPLHVTGEETDLHAQGNLDLTGKRQLDVAANGSINFELAESIDPDLTARGTTTFRLQPMGLRLIRGCRDRLTFRMHRWRSRTCLTA